MSQKWKLIHIKSKQRGEDELSPKLPTSDQLEYGEIAINYGHGVETIAIRNDNDEIVKFIPEHKVREYIDSAIKAVIPSILRQIEEKIDTMSLPETDDVSIDSGEY